VLGCRVRLDESGRLRSGALRARVDAAAATYAQNRRPGTIVVASGGRRWDGMVEADAMARELACLGVPDEVIVRERDSLTTRDNARMTADALARRGVRRAAVVTSDWHLARAVALFQCAGVCVVGVAAAPDRDARWTSRMWRRHKERLLMWMQVPLED